MTDKGLNKDIVTRTEPNRSGDLDSVVLEKSIFSNIFEKDIRRVYIFRKSERIAKALHMVLPAFKDTKTLKDRIEGLALAIVDASVLTPTESREAMSRSLLSLSSVLSMARVSGILSPMNVAIITREVHSLLQDVAGYEDPRLSLPDAPTLSTLARALPGEREQGADAAVVSSPKLAGSHKGQSNGHSRPRNGQQNGQERKDAILSILKDKGPSYIKDISMVIREVSEKTIQRELSALVVSGQVKKTGERRWTVYEIVQ